MSVSKLDSNGDWRFGKSLADYTRNSGEIAQNVVTRIKSFANDWFLDTSANIDWFTILGNRNNEQVILREVSRVVTATDGVKTIDSIEPIVNRQSRSVVIRLEYTDIFDAKFQEDIGITNGA